MVATEVIGGGSICVGSDDLNWLLSASHRFVSISWASCFLYYVLRHA